MAHFAEIDTGTNTVLRVVVVHNDYEHRGQEFLADDLGLGGAWVQTSYSGSIRNKFAAIGDTYDEALDAFVPSQPYPSWALDENYVWQPPTPMPGDGKVYVWDEDTTSWVEAE